jgi:hypothetical protein
MTPEQTSLTPPRYYYRSTRHGDQVRRKYIGSLSDPFTALLYHEKQLLKATRQAQQRQADEEANRYRDIEKRIKQYHHQAKLLLESWRENRGYRECENGNWRPRKRRRRKPIMNYPDLRLLTKQAEDGDDEALRQLRLLMDGNESLWKPLGDLSAYAIRQLMDETVGNNVALREGLTRYMDELKNKLSGESPSSIRKLAVDQVLITWLDIHYQILLASQAGLSKTVRVRLESRVQRAHKRYTGALETLTRVKSVEEGGE